MTAHRAERVRSRLGMHLRRVGAPGSSVDPDVLLGTALRRNPLRAQLLVSRVLGKHVPTDPRVVRAAGCLLGAMVADVLDGRPARPAPEALLRDAVRGRPGAAAELHRRAEPSGTGPDALVLGYAETATGLGHCVAEALRGSGPAAVGPDYLHSTRRVEAGTSTAGRFVEEHSHATDHLLTPADPGLLRGGRPLVLVDDELSTGRTVRNTVRELHRNAPRDRVVVAALVDVRPEGSTLLDEIRGWGVQLDVVSLGRVALDLPDDLAARAGRLREELDREPVDGVVRSPSDPPAGGDGPDTHVDLTSLGWPSGLPVGGRHGFTADDHAALAAALPGLAAALGDACGITRREHTLVLGTEEMMALPLRVAQTLADDGFPVAFSTTTRSPALVLDEPGYALRSGIAFPAHDDPDDGPGMRYAYNLGRAGVPTPWDRIVVFTDRRGDTAVLRSGLLRALRPLAGRIDLVVSP